MNCCNLFIWHIANHLFSWFFFYPKLLMICLLQFLFIKCSNNFFTIKITNNICWRNNVFECYNHKNFFGPIWSISCSKYVWYFDILTWSPTLNLGSSLLFFNKINIFASLPINRLPFDSATICITVFIHSFI